MMTQENKGETTMANQEYMEEIEITFTKDDFTEVDVLGEVGCDAGDLFAVLIEGESEKHQLSENDEQRATRQMLREYRELVERHNREWALERAIDAADDWNDGCPF
jgi:hypothetical protein